MAFHLSVSGNIIAKLRQSRNELEAQNEKLSLREIFNGCFFGHWEFERMLKVNQAWVLPDRQRK